MHRTKGIIREEVMLKLNKKRLKGKREKQLEINL